MTRYALSALLALLWSCLPAFAQGSPTTFPGKVRIFSTADDALAVGCSGVSPTSCTGGIFGGKIILEAPTTSGVRIDVESGTLAAREGDDSTYVPFRALSAGFGRAPSDFGVALGTGTPASTTGVIYTPDGVSLYFNGDLLGVADAVSGTTNRVPKFDSGASIGDSSITDDGSTVSSALPAAFASLNTGQGANELYAMNQPVQTSDTVRFAVMRTANTGLRMDDTDGSHDLILSPGSNVSANRTLTLTTGDANRTLSLGGDLTTSGGSYTIDQSVSIGSGPAFTNAVLTTPNLGTPSAVNLTNATNIPAGQLTGSIADARLSSNVALLADNETVTGFWLFSRAGDQINIRRTNDANDASIDYENAAGSRLWRMGVSDGGTSWRLYGDSLGDNAIGVTTAGAVSIPVSLSIGGGSAISSSSNVALLSASNTFTGATQDLDSASDAVWRADRASTSFAAALRLRTGGSDNWLIGMRSEAGSPLRFYSDALGDNAMSLTTAGVLSVNGFGVHTVSASSNSDNVIAIGNPNTGNSARSMLRLGNNEATDQGRIFQTGGNYSGSGYQLQDSLVVEANGGGGMSIVANEANADLRFYTNNTLRGAMTDAGVFDWDGTASFDNTVTVNGVNNAVAVDIIGGATSSQSFGLRVTAGTNSSDYVALFQNKAGSLDILRLRGDGAAIFGGSVTLGGNFIGYAPAGPAAGMVFASDNSPSFHADTMDFLINSNNGDTTLRLSAESSVQWRFIVDDLLDDLAINLVTTEFMRFDSSQTNIDIAVDTYFGAAVDFLGDVKVGGVNACDGTPTSVTEGIAVTCSLTPSAHAEWLLGLRPFKAAFESIWSELAFLRAEVQRLGGRR